VVCVFKGVVLFRGGGGSSLRSTRPHALHAPSAAHHASSAQSGTSSSLRSGRFATCVCVCVGGGG
jgi:hypothetical protein